MTRSGVKLLDFGLAKRVTLRNRPGLRESTQDKTLTFEGMVAGTLKYMAPEQLEGKDLDERTDVFALGCVLYQMATGQRAFEGDSEAGIIAAILQSDPAPVSLHQPTIPPSFDRLVKACLTKDPEERVQTAHDVLLQLRSIAADAATAAPRIERRRSVQWLPWSAALAGAVIAVAAIVLKGRQPDPTIARPRTLSIVLPAQVSSSSRRALAISRDGKKMAVVLRLSNGVNQLHVRSIEDGSLVPLAGTEGAHSPFFSPDGAWLGFAAQQKLKKMPLANGPPIELCDAPSFNGGAWATDGTIVFAPSYDAGLSFISAEGGQPRPLTRLDAARKEFAHRWPRFLPGGNEILFSVFDLSHDLAKATLDVVSLSSGQRRALLQGAVDGSYVPSGHLLFLREEALYTIPFDSKSVRVSGTAAPALHDVASSWFGGSAAFDVAEDGSLIYLPTDRAGIERELVWVTRKGEVQPISRLRRAFNEPRLSPDGRRLVVTIGTGKGEGRGDLWVNEMARDSWTRLTSEGSTNATAQWAPNGQKIYFSSNRSGKFELFQMRLDGSAATQLTEGPDWPWPVSVSPDGKTLAFGHIGPKTSWDIWIVPTDGTGQSRPLLNAPFSERAFVFSPNGRWIAHTSDESGTTEVYLQPYPPTGQRWLISDGGGTLPKWPGNGSEVFYRNGREVMAARVKTEPVVVIDKPVVLFEGDYHSTFDEWDASSDGERIVMIRRTGPHPQPQLTMVLGWADSLRPRR